MLTHVVDVVKRHLAVIVMVGAVLAGCATEGREFSSDLGWLKKNITKQQDVKLVLGEPNRVGETDGQATWTYGFYRYKLVGQSLTKELKLYWNPDKTVQSWSFSSSFPEDKAIKAPSAKHHH